tara:strand:+ start:290 stop:493 length:204 start_codon:yes stop_codon:yes gene_type:complete
MVKLLLGEFTFLDPVIDGEHKCIINKVEKVVEFDCEDLACKSGEDMLELGYESYLVLPTYKGEVVYE